MQEAEGDELEDDDDDLSAHAVADYNGEDDEELDADEILDAELVDADDTQTEAPDAVEKKTSCSARRRGA